MQDLSLSRSIRSVDIVDWPLLGKVADTDDTRLEERHAVRRPSSPRPRLGQADGHTDSYRLQQRRPTMTLSCSYCRPWLPGEP